MTTLTIPDTRWVDVYSKDGRHQQSFALVGNKVVWQEGPNPYKNVVFTDWCVIKESGKWTDTPCTD